jgi:hypothetical protein
MASRKVRCRAPKAGILKLAIAENERTAKEREHSGAWQSFAARRRSSGR